MVIKVYISGISGNKEVKKRQQRVLMILDSKNIKYDVVDIAEPGNEEAKEFMQSNSKCMGATVGDANPRSPLPPQIFNDEEYCGDYDQFDLSNEIDEIEKFLKMAIEESVTSSTEIKLGNGQINAENVENENEAEAKQDAPEEVQKEEEKIEEKTEAKEENLPEPDTKIESEAKDEINEASEVKDEINEDSETKIENEAEEPDSNKVENGTNEVDSSPTEIEA